jgi:hypothetical protein
MNGIVQVTDKPVRLIDTLRSETAKEAVRHRDALSSWAHCPYPSLVALAEKVAAAELFVATPKYQALTGTIKAAFAPASIAEIKRELGLLFACFPAKDIDVGLLVAAAVEDVIDDRPNKLQLQLGCRLARRTSKFRPSISEILDALDDVEDGSAMSTAREILEVPKRLDLASSLLRDRVGSVLKSIEGLLSDRGRHRQSPWRITSIDERLGGELRFLESVSAHRPKALEAQRPLIIHSINITENEKANAENQAVVGPGDEIPW